MYTSMALGTDTLSPVGRAGMGLGVGFFDFFFRFFSRFFSDFIFILFCYFDEHGLVMD